MAKYYIISVRPVFTGSVKVPVSAWRPVSPAKNEITVRRIVFSGGTHEPLAAVVADHGTHSKRILLDGYELKLFDKYRIRLFL